MMRIVAIAAVATLAVGAGHALAQPTLEPGASAMVGYADLDLSSPGGRAALRARVRAAIDRVCPEQDGRRLEMRQWRQECRAHARANADRQMAAVLGEGRLAQNAVLISSR